MAKFNKNIKTALFLLSFWAIGGNMALAQAQVRDVRLLSYQEGLSNRAVLDVVQDSRGFLWVATEYGLNRFDGYQFEVFDDNAKTRFRLSHSNIGAVQEVADGKLALFSNRKEPYFQLFDLDNFSCQKVWVNQEHGVEGEQSALFAEQNGLVYVLNTVESGFRIYSVNSKGHIAQPVELATSQPPVATERAFIKGRSGHFWILDERDGLLEVAEDGRLLRRVSSQVIMELTKPAALAYSTSILHEDTAGNIWVAFPHRQGVFWLKKGHLSLAPVPGLPPEDAYNKLWEDAEGQILIGSFLTFGRLKQLFLMKKDAAKPENYRAILEKDDKITAVCSRDFTRQLTIGTYVGVYLANMQPQPLHWVLASRALEDGDWSNGISIRGITGDDQGNIYIARELKAWYRYQPENHRLDTLQLLDKTGQPISLWCNSNIVLDGKGRAWGGSCTNDRMALLHAYDLPNKSTRTFQLDYPNIRQVVLKKNGDLWLLCGKEEAQSGRLYVFAPNQNTFTLYLNKNGTNPLENCTPNYLLEGQDGLLWVGTDAGLVKIDQAGGTSERIGAGKGSFSNGYVFVVHQSPDGSLLLGTNGGLNIYQPATGLVTTYSVADGLSNNTVCGILPARGKGCFWLSTFNGLSHFDSKTGLFSNFFKSNGLSFNEFNRLAFYLDKQGRYYFGTLNGVNVFKEEELLHDHALPFPLQWTKMAITTRQGEETLHQKSFEALHRLVLTPDDAHVFLSFTLPDFNASQHNRYAYQLEGIDTSWHYLSNTPQLELNVPPPGQYRLRVKGAGSNGAWQAQELQLELVVQRAFYETTAFWVGMPLALLLLVWGILMGYTRRIRRKEAEQTVINKKFAELELQALQAQMNPHFVFNSLGAIQFFIQNHDTKAADDYLAKFAKLMRLFLESSKNKYITLAEETKLLSLYVELERMRFGEKFDATFTVSEDLDIHSVEIPSVLLQPFVENAINHGLFHLQRRGHLLVDFRQKDGGVVCTIEDNGVGREKSRKLQESSRKHISRGMQIVHERLEVLRQVDEMKIKLTIEDVQPTGTRVVVWLPILD